MIQLLSASCSVWSLKRSASHTPHLCVVEEILLRSERATLQKIYGLPEFSNTLELLTVLALSSGRLLKVTLTHTSRGGH